VSPLNETSILLTNDDGVDAEGLASLRMALGGLGEITVVAPREHMSATSHAISLYKPVRYEKLSAARYAVHGTPVDSVILALNEILKRPPALVISGINQGGNLGQNVFYSGTVAAAVEGTFHGIPSAAVSLAALRGASFDASAMFMRRLVPVLLEHGLPPGVTLNINVPYGRSHRGARLTHRAHPEARSYVLEPEKANGQSRWIRERIEMDKVGEGSDHAAIRQGYISITPLVLDAPSAPPLRELERWINSLGPLVVQ
jgi:5'/3'-nucleotidase